MMKKKGGKMEQFDGDFEPVEGNMEEFSLREDSLPALVVGDATLPAREQRRVRFKTIDEENRGGGMEAADDAKAEDDLEEGEPGQALQQSLYEERENDENCLKKIGKVDRAEREDEDEDANEDEDADEDEDAEEEAAIRIQKNVRGAAARREVEKERFRREMKWDTAEDELAIAIAQAAEANDAPPAAKDDEKEQGRIVKHKDVQQKGSSGDAPGREVNAGLTKTQNRKSRASRDMPNDQHVGERAGSVKAAKTSGMRSPADERVARLTARCKSLALARKTAEKRKEGLQQKLKEVQSHADSCEEKVKSMKRILRQAENKFKVELTKKAVENSALRDEVHELTRKLRKVAARIRNKDDQIKEVNAQHEAQLQNMSLQVRESMDNQARAEAAFAKAMKLLDKHAHREENNRQMLLSAMQPPALMQLSPSRSSGLSSQYSYSNY